MDLLKDIAWAFNSVSYDDRETFDKAVTQYQHDVLGHADHWRPSEVVLQSPGTQIIYEYYISPGDTRFDDETFLDEDEADVQVEDPEEENEQTEIAVTFRADDGKAFTAGELLYKLHQRLWHRQLGDHIFFKGLLACNVPERKDPPLFYLHCSS